MDQSNMNQMPNQGFNPNPVNYSVPRPPKKDNTGVWIAVIIAISLTAIIIALLCFGDRDKSYKSSDEGTFYEYSNAFAKLEKCLNERSTSLEDWCIVMYPRNLYDYIESQTSVFGMNLDDYAGSMFDTLYSKIDDSVGDFKCTISIISDEDVTDLELDNLNDEIKEIYDSINMGKDAEEITNAKTVRVKMSIKGEKKSFSKETSIMVYKYGNDWYINPSSLKDLKDEV